MEFLTILFGVMIFFFVTKGLNAKYKPRCGHQTSYTIILGMTVSLVLWMLFGKERVDMYSFRQEVFFDYILPPIILNSGFNMKRRKFFQNFGNVGILGLGVTFVCFALYSILSFYALKYGGLTMVNYSFQDLGNGGPVPIEIDVMPLMLFTALLCSSDVVAAVSIVSYEAQPALYSCIFGEGVVNDIVSIILFNTVQSLQGTPFYWYTIFIIAGQFLLLGFISTGVGLFFAFFLCLILKHVRFLSSSPIIESFLILAFAFMSYLTSNMIRLPSGLEMSGIISLLTYGIVTAHYTYHNLSPQGRTVSTLGFTFTGEVAEAVVYSYVGVALYSTIPTWWSWSFIFLQLAIIFGGRVISVISTWYCCRLYWRKKTIAFNELVFITYAGMIRGVIAFGLVLKIQWDGQDGIACPTCYSKQTYQLMVSTTLMLVVFTTLIFGTFMDVVQKLLMPPKELPTDDHKEGSEETVSSYEEIVHPNEEVSVFSSAPSRRPSYTLGNSATEEPPSWTNSRFVNWFLVYDETKLRPFLIRKYSAIKA